MNTKLRASSSFRIDESQDLYRRPFIPEQKYHTSTEIIIMIIIITIMIIIIIMIMIIVIVIIYVFTRKD